MSLHSLILAAGCASRFTKNLPHETPKQLATINGKPMLQRAIELAIALTPEAVTVVLGYKHELMQPLAQNINTVINNEWEKGIGNSIACGIGALPAEASAVFILLADQPALQLMDLQELSACYHKYLNNPKIVCAHYGKSFGVPAIFPRYFFSQLLALEGDQGAKKILLSNPVISLPLPNAAIDIDTHKDWHEFTNHTFNKYHQS